MSIACALFIASASYAILPSSMAQAKSFRELAVYRLVRREALKIVRLTQKFPADEQLALSEPMRRSSRAVGGHIAEAWGRRSNPAAFSASRSEEHTSEL